MSSVSRGAVRPSPPKPYERAGGTSSVLNRQNLTSSAPTPSTTALSTSPRTPARPPLRPWERGTGFGSSYNGYGSSYNNGYGSSYNNSYGSGYGSSYGSGYGLGSSYGNGYGYGRSPYGGSTSYGGGSDYYGRDPYSPYSGDMPGKPLNNAVNRGYSWMESLYTGVHSFGRFSQVLDANFDAMNGSFRSVLMLIERMGHLNYEVGNFLKGFTLLKVLQSLISRYSAVFKYLFARKSSSRRINGPQTKGGWDLKEFDTGEIATRPSITSFMVVFAVTFIGIPFLFTRLVKFLSKLAQNEPESLENGWKRDAEDSVVRALYDFEPETPQDLGFRAGDVIQVTSKPHPDSEWWEGEIDGRRGIFPSNYVEPLKQKMLEVGAITETSNYNSNKNNNININNDDPDHQEEFEQELHVDTNTFHNNFHGNHSNHHNNYNNNSNGPNDWATEERRFRTSRNGHPV